MVKDRKHHPDFNNSVHAEGFDDFRAGSLALDVVNRERRDEQERALLAQQAMLSGIIFHENMTGIGDKGGIGLGTLITNLMTAAGSPPTPEQAKALAILNGPAAESSTPRPGHTATSYADQLLGHNTGITMPRDMGTGLRGLLNTIAHFETHRTDNHGNNGYDRVYGRANTVPLTHMTINQVLAWQDDYVANGSKSSAAGRYQIIRGTLRGLVQDMNLTGNEMFDQDMQDHMALTLLKQAGLDRYLAGRIDADSFQDRIANTWASIERTNGHGAHDHDGLNRAADGSGNMVLAALRTLGPAPSLN